MKKIEIKYNGSVLTKAGFRSVMFTAKALMISDKRAKIIEVIDINGDGVGYASRTGASRQKYNGSAAAEMQKGKIKNLSSCQVVKIYKDE